MKTKIIIGILMSVFVISILPSISATEFYTVKQINKLHFIEQINLTLSDLQKL